MRSVEADKKKAAQMFHQCTNRQCFGSVLNLIRIRPKLSIRIRIQKTLNHDPDRSYFLRLSENNIKFFPNYTILSSKEVN